MAKVVLKTRPTGKSVPAHIAAIADPVRRADARRLLALMREASGKTPKMWGSGLIGFGDISYTSKSGREVEWFQIGLAVRKDAFSLYLMCDLNEASVLLKKLGTHKRGVGCLYVKRLADVDERVLKTLLKMAATTKPQWVQKA